MLQSDLSIYISQKFLNSGLLEEDDVDVMAYYLENIISLSLVTFSIIGIAILTGLYKESVLYFLIFYVGRHCCGGYHAQTHFRCYMLTMGTYLLFLLVTIGFKNVGNSNVIMIFMITVINVLIFAFAPADSENKRFTKKERRVYRQKSLLLLVCCDLLYAWSLTIPSMYSLYFFSVFFAVLQLAISVTIAKMFQ